jgi:hypothetical protein
MRKLFEEYIESADYKISTFFKELQAQIEKWFTDGSLAAQGCELDGDVQTSNYNPMEKFLIFNFIEPITPEIEEKEEEGESYRYRVIFMIRLDQMKGDEGAPAQAPAQGEAAPVETPTEGKSLEINKVLLKIHQFDENNKEKGELVEEVDVEDIKEDFFIDKLGQLKDKSENTETDQNDLKDNIYTK